MIDELARRRIRYCLFRKKAKVMEGKPAPNGDDFEKMHTTEEQYRWICDNIKPPAGLNIRDFPEKWDVGIDDIPTMMDRGEKYWLFGIKKTSVVRRPKRMVTLLQGNSLVEQLLEFTDSVLEGERFFLEKGFAEQRVIGKTKSGKEIFKTFILYDEILEGVSTRTTWGDK
jgi:hypothetical protein